MNCTPMADVLLEAVLHHFLELSLRFLHAIQVVHQNQAQ
jgi:hypothetical protein